jgi:hypothetical protein
VRVHPPLPAAPCPVGIPCVSLGMACGSLGSMLQAMRHYFFLGTGRQCSAGGQDIHGGFSGRRIGNDRKRHLWDSNPHGETPSAYGPTPQPLRQSVDAAPIITSGCPFARTCSWVSPILLLAGLACSPSRVGVKHQPSAPHLQCSGVHAFAKRCLRAAT